MKLTDREISIMREIAFGKIEKEIADVFRISPMTVHAHARNIRQKTGARTKVDITRIYFTKLRPTSIIRRHVHS